MNIKDQTALIIIDMINDFKFDQGTILAHKALQIADRINNLRDIFDKNNQPVIFVNDHYNLWKADINKIIEHCRNDKSIPLFDRLLPTEKDFFLIKPKHSAFFGTSLNTLLYHLKVKHLMLTGIAGNICVLFTANDAYMREYNLFIPQNCIASVDDTDNQYALRMMKNVLQANIDPIRD